VELAFETKPLRDICENESAATRTFGLEVAEILKRRLADLRAASSVKDLVAGNPHELDAVDAGSMAVELCGRHRMVFCPNHPKRMMTGRAKPDWASVSRIRILRIDMDAHDT
jgi:plasmid maintenance system killer protein